MAMPWFTPEILLPPIALPARPARLSDPDVFVYHGSREHDCARAHVPDVRLSLRIGGGATKISEASS
jgi:hypothetical protein